MTDRRVESDGKPASKGRGRRVGDPIVDLETHPARFVSVTVAMDYINREVCSVSRQTFYKWIASGSLPTRKMTREISIKTDDLRMFVMRQLRQSA